MPEGGRQEHAAVYLPPDTVAIVGGITPNASAKVAPFSSTDLVQLYSITDDTWRTVAPLPKRLNHPNVAAANGKIYVFGGFDDGGEERERMLAVPDSWVYDPATDAWSSIPPLQVARAQAALAEFDGKIFVAGGFTELILNDQVPLPATLDHVSVFDTDTLTWVTDYIPEKAKNLPEPRDHARAAVVDEKMYVIGGFNFGGFNQTDSVFVLDFQDLEAGWETRHATSGTIERT
ncbi:kelch repeat-containing protein [Neofusicoccum parvum]|uniref:Kelch repeat-containing protein n=1 Tax=Neofusicoccum parvum TaxID=310453 RepID=A0ACB5SM46_9PEZI|nr:kelch repeat-containing protein [Neofusicoccum parvum]